MNIDPQETLGQRIRRLRLEKGMTQSELADGFVTTSMISQVESGKNTPSVELIQHIAKKLQIPLHDLIRNEVEQMENAWKHQLAKVYLLTKQASEAELLLEGLLSLKDLSQSHQIELTVDLAESYYLQKKFEDALKILLPLVEELESITFDDVRMLAQIHWTIGNVYFQKQSYTNSGYHYRRASDLTLRFPDFDYLAAKIHFCMGIVFQLQGFHQESEFFLKKAYEYFQHTESISEIASILVAQGITYKNMNEYKLASDTLSHAIALFKAIKMIHESYDVKVTLAASVTSQSDPDLAIEQLLDCIGPYQEAKSHSDLILVYSKIAFIQVSRNQLENAYASLNAARIVISNHGQEVTPSAGVCYQTLSFYYSKINNNNNNAIKYALKSAEIFGTIGLLMDQVESLQLACDAYHLLGDDTNAFKIERQCNQILRKLNGRGSIL